jgi:hypothetical protein
MKNLGVLAVVLGSLSLAPSAFAGNPTGTWKWTTNFHNQSLECTVRLKLDSEGPRLTGAFIDGTGTQSLPIADSSFKDGKLSFALKREFNGKRLTIKYTGVVNSDTIAGTSQIEDGGQVQTSDWLAQRQK